jgi:hypothetical protein
MRSLGQIDAIAALDSNHLIVAGGGSDHYFHSTDAGSTWNSIPAPARQYYLVGASYPAPNSIVVVQYDTAYGWSRLYRFLSTTDFGQTWLSSARTSHDIAQLCFINSLVGFAAGWTYAGTFTNYLDRTTDGGMTWTTIYTSAPGQAGEFRAIAFADSLHGIVCGRGGLVLHTTDGGQTWPVEATGYDGLLDAVAYPSPDHAILGSVALPPGDGLIYVTDALPDTPDITYPAASQPGGVPPEFDATWTMVSDAAGYDVLLLGFDGTKGCWCDTLVHDTVTTNSHHFKLPSDEKQYYLYVTALIGDKKGNPAFRTFIVFQASVTSSASQLNRLSIFPNPVRSEASVTFTSDAQIGSAKVIDLLGREVMNFTNRTDGSFTFDTRSLTDGVYTLIVKSEGRVVTGQFVVAR